MPEQQHGAPLEPAAEAKNVTLPPAATFKDGAPAVIIPEMSMDAWARTAQAKLFALHALLEERWTHPDNEELSPLRGALILSEGWSEFRRDIIRELDALNRMHPDLIGREDWSDVARSVWRRLRKRLFAWSVKQLGRPQTPRQVIALFEKFYHRKSPLAMATTKFTVEDTDAISGIDGTQRGWQSSGLRREGTIAELAADAAPSVAKDELLNQIDESLEDEKAGRLVDKEKRVR